MLTPLVGDSEENVYLLCKQLSQSGIAAPDASDLFVVFISNPNRQIPLWCQKAGCARSDGLVIWDYHVICIQTKNDAETVVWDLDTSLQFPEVFSLYVTRALQPSLNLSSAFQRFYRVVSGGLFLKYFASDRRHMKTAEGSWKMPPPPYDCIRAEDGTVHNLEGYLDMSQETALLTGLSCKELQSLGHHGAVLNENSMHRLFGGSSVFLSKYLSQDL